MKLNLTFTGGLLAALLAMSGCNSSSTETTVDPVKKIEANDKKSNTSTMISIDGSLFSISSPLESIVLLKNSATSFNEDVMMELPDIAKLTSNFDKAVNLGMLGADMGYASIHNQQMKSIDQFKVLSDLTTSLNLSNAVDEGLIKRLANNTDNMDSLMILVSEFYREADQYLQENDRMDVASWILAGGWIESMHFSMDVIENGNEDLKERIAGQRNSYKNLVDLVKKSSNSPKSMELVKDLEKMDSIFEEVIYTYNYDQPEVNIDTKTTHLKGTTEYKFTDETLLKLSTSINELRNKMILQ